jgi:hypothetical protein
MPGLPRRKITTNCPPMSSIMANYCKQSESLLVQNKQTWILERLLEVLAMEYKNLGELV